MKAFITGSSGFIGSELVKRFKSPICFDRKHGDIRNFGEIYGAIQGCDVVFHLASNTDSRAGIENPQIDYTNQIIGTMNVLESMILCGIKKIVYTSTCGVYGDNSWKNEEYSPLAPLCPYAQCKLVCEWMIRDYVEKHSIQAWILRLGNAVGGGMKNGVIRDFILKLKEDKTHLPVLGSPDPRRPFMSVEDCVDGMLYVFEHSNEQFNLFNLSGSESTSVGEIAEMILEETGLNIPIHYQRGVGWVGSASRVEMNIDKIKKLGWEPKLNSTEAVRKAIKELLDGEGRD